MHESFSDGVLGNARRLRTDAAILFDKGRFPSCVLLLLFCLEELGKAFLISLGSLPAKQLHRHKQVAGLCLAMGSGMIRVYDSQLGDWRTALGEENYGEEFEEKFETILQSIEDKDTIIALWKPYQVLGMSKEGVLEKIRQMAAYFDADDERDLSGSVKADTLDCSFVTELSILVDDAMMCFDDRFALSMAKLFYVARS